MKESQQLSDEIKKVIQLSLIKDTMVTKESIIQEDLSIIKTYKPNATNRDEISQQQLVNKKVGDIVQTIFKSFLESGKCDVSLIAFLQTESYSKHIFNMNFPILVKISNVSEMKEKMVDYLGRSRYYATPLRINGEIYLLTSQWYDKNKSYLVKWISSYSVQ